MSVKRTVALQGSERRPMPGAIKQGPVSGDEPIEVTITLKAPADLATKVKEIGEQPLGGTESIFPAKNFKKLTVKAKPIWRWWRNSRAITILPSRAKIRRSTRSRSWECAGYESSL